MKFFLNKITIIKMIYINEFKIKQVSIIKKENCSFFRVFKIHFKIAINHLFNGRNLSKQLWN